MKDLEVHKKELMGRLVHLNSLLEVVPKDNPKFGEYSRELYLTIIELRELKIKEEKNLALLN